MSDARYMRQALRLAARGDTSPNPRVGSVVVKDGQVLATGFHARAGQPHAEVEALKKLNFSAPGATLYVNLEPCSHFGRTPPCTDAILRAGVTRVVAGMVDPNPLVSGRGFELLRSAGVEVVTGVLEAECQALNRGFVKAITTHKPYVTLKLAATADGKTATRTGASRWITSPDSRALVHQWRAHSDAVLVGVGTVLKDDPQLTARLERPVKRRPPLRVVLDTHLRAPAHAKVFSPDAPTLVICGENAPFEAEAALLAVGVQVARVPELDGHLELAKALELLYQRGVVYVFAEPGATLAAALMHAHLVDRCCFFYAPHLFGGQNAPGMLGGTGVEKVSDAVNLRFDQIRRVGPDLLVEARVVPESSSP